MKPDAYKQERYQFMGAASEIYNDFGYGLAEEMYRECLELELAERRIPFQSNRLLPTPFRRLAFISEE